ncbi:hypothetical protein QR680_014112 [Steinernema hermaphroditum]|uniref:Uncharacterized protein n=1 Tax=Steinernema hermaphroditum TaxID=289476 RepID=A0AA39I7R2_9BILA|nr:hypothetical protein QR680_014112 [Steinernema hermaphroditum]
MIAKTFFQILGSIRDWLCCGTRTAHRSRTSASSAYEVDGTPPIQTAPQRNGGRKISPIEGGVAQLGHLNNQQHVIVRQKFDSKSTSPETSARITRPQKCLKCSYFANVPPQVPKLMFGVPHDFTNTLSSRSSDTEYLRKLSDLLGWFFSDSF